MINIIAKNIYILPDQLKITQKSRYVSHPSHITETNYKLNEIQGHKSDRRVRARSDPLPWLIGFSKGTGSKNITKRKKDCVACSPHICKYSVGWGLLVISTCAVPLALLLSNASQPDGNAFQSARRWQDYIG